MAHCVIDRLRMFMHLCHVRLQYFHPVNSFIERPVACNLDAIYF